MVVVRFRDSEEHSDLLHKIKKMRKFTEELEDMLNRKPRKIVSSKAPAEGLTLVRVIYDEELGL